MLVKYLLLFLVIIVIGLTCRSITEPLKMYDYPRLLKWTSDTLGQTGDQSLMFNVWGSSVNDVYVCGHSSSALGNLWRYDGEKWYDVDLRYLSSSIYFLELEGDIFGFNKNDIWAVGHWLVASSPTVPYTYSDSTLILHYDGVSWNEESLKRQATQLISIWGSSRDELWAGGRKSSFYRYNGTRWETYILDLPPNEDLDEENGYIINHISGNQAGVVYLNVYRVLKNMKNGCMLYTFKNNKWTVFDSTRFLYKDVHDLWVSPSGNLYVSSDRIYMYNGLSWTEIFDIGGYSINGTADNNIFITSRNHMKEGLLYHYNGKDWHLIKEVGGNMFYGDLWTDGKEVFVIGITGGSCRQRSVVWHGK